MFLSSVLLHSLDDEICSVFALLEVISFYDFLIFSNQNHQFGKLLYIDKSVPLIIEASI